MAGDRLAEQRRHSERWDVQRLIREEGPSPQPSGLAADEPEAKRLARGLLRVLQQEVILAPEFAGHVTNISKLLLCHDVAEPLRDEVLGLFADLVASMLQQLSQSLGIGFAAMLIGALRSAHHSAAMTAAVSCGI